MNVRFFLLSVGMMLLVSQLATAQELQIIDAESREPVENVYVFNNGRNKIESSNVEGTISLAKFTAEDTLNFQHSGYKPFAIAYAALEEQSYTVVLEARLVSMEQIYISASKREQDLTEIPQKVARISEEQLLFGNPQTSADLLQNSGEVFMQKSQMGGGSPMIRGFAANSVLIAVDGIRMNNAIFRSGNLQNVISVDPNALESTEVLFGPGSTIYGSDALGGVMNFQTKSPDLSYSNDKTVSSINVMSRYSSANHERTIHADAGVGFKNLGLHTSISYSYFDDLRSGGDFYDEYPNFGKRKEYVVRRNGQDLVIDNEDITVQKFSGYEQINLMQKVRYEPTDNLEASYGFHYASTRDIPRYDRLIERENGDTGQFVNAEWYYGPQIWMMNNLKLDYNHKTFLFNKVAATLSHQWFQESRNDRDFQDVKLRNREENINVYIASLDFDKLWNSRQALYYGVEAVHNYVGSEAYMKNINIGSTTAEATRYPDSGSDYTQLAAYAKYKHELSSNLTAVAGARYSHVVLDADFTSDSDTTFYSFPFDKIKFNTGAANGSLGITYRPAESLQFNLNASTGFRAPNVDDAAKVFDSEPGTVIVPNDNIKPEKSYNIDLSVIKDFNDVARLELNTYYTWLKDAMVRRDFQFNGQDSIMYDGTRSKVEAVVNAGKAYVYGASIGLTAQLGDHFSLDSELTYTNGRDISNDEPLRHVAPLFGLAGMSYQTQQFKVRLYTEFNGKKDISDFSPSERSKKHLYTKDGSPAWATLNLKTSYQLNKEVQLNAGIENILDKHYRPYSSGISAAGRNISMTVRAHL